MKLNHEGKRLLLVLAGVLLAVNIWSQQTVKGNVKDELGEPVIGANVLVKGTSNGAITDLDGNYTIQDVSPKATLVFSYVGYLSQEIAVAGKNVINCVLKEYQKFILRSLKNYLNITK